MVNDSYIEYVGGPWDGLWAAVCVVASQTPCGTTKDGFPAYVTYVRVVRGGRERMLFIGYCERGDEAIDLICRGQGIRRIR